MKLHTAGEDYLEAVLILQKKLGMVRSVDVARYMEVSKPSVCYAVGTLREGGFLTTDENHYLHLTDLGQEVAEKIYERHCFLTKQLMEFEQTYFALKKYPRAFLLRCCFHFQNYRGFCA